MDFCIIKIKAQPNAKKTETAGWLDNETLKIKIAAPPVDDKANRKLVEFLADNLHAPKSNIEICGGQHSKIKRIKIIGFSIEKFKELLISK